MNMNYFKDTDEILSDFRSLTFMQKQCEASKLLDKYLFFSKEDFRLIGCNTSKTQNIYNLYRLFKDIILADAKEMAIHSSLAAEITVKTPIYDTKPVDKSAKKVL